MSRSSERHPSTVAASNVTVGEVGFMLGTLNCLLPNHCEDKGNLNPIGKQQMEKVSFMVDSGASETVASSNMFVGFSKEFGTFQISQALIATTPIFPGSVMYVPMP